MAEVLCSDVIGLRKTRGILWKVCMNIAEGATNIEMPSCFYDDANWPDLMTVLGRGDATCQILAQLCAKSKDIAMDHDKHKTDSEKPILSS